MTWQDRRSGPNFDIYGTRVAADGTILDPQGIAISVATDNQLAPTVAFDGANYLVIWEDWCSGFYSDIYGARINPAGIVIDSFVVSAQPGNQISRPWHIVKDIMKNSSSH